MLAEIVGPLHANGHPHGGVVFCADLIPGRPWVHVPITMGYDRNAELLIDEKRAFLDDMLERDVHLYFTHDPGCALARVVKSPGRPVRHDPRGARAARATARRMKGASRALRADRRPAPCTGVGADGTRQRSVAVEPAGGCGLPRRIQAVRAGTARGEMLPVAAGRRRWLFPRMERRADRFVGVRRRTSQSVAPAGTQPRLVGRLGVDGRPRAAAGRGAPARPVADAAPQLFAPAGRAREGFPARRRRLASSDNPLAPATGDVRITWHEFVLPPLAGKVELRNDAWQLSPKVAAAPATARPRGRHHRRDATARDAPAPVADRHCGPRRWSACGSSLVPSPEASTDAARNASRRGPARPAAARASVADRRRPPGPAHRLGDGGDPALLQRIRVHANFVEYVPFALLLLALVEMSGLRREWVGRAGRRAVCRARTACDRLSRSAGVSFGRLWGTLGTWCVILAASIIAIARAITALVPQG